MKPARCSRCFSTTSPRIQNSKSDGDSSTPWYLRKENSSQSGQVTHDKFPELPYGTPQGIKDLLTLLVKKYGLTSLKVYDLAALPADHPKYTDEQSPQRFIILASGKSEKHIYKASYELKQHVKHEYGYLPRIEGMTSNAISTRARRRLAKRARQGPPATHNDFGIGQNSWVRCELGVEGAVVHILSDERRVELNLESLFEEEGGDVEVPHVETPTQKRTYEDTESVFFGLRRHFHTSSSRQDVAQLKSIVKSCAENPSDKSLELFKNDFDSTFTGASVEEWSEKFALYKLLHLRDPSIASFKDLEKVLLEKHASIQLLGEEINWNQEIVNDVIRYMEAVLDINEPLPASEKLSMLSSFISRITSFSRDELHFFAVDKFQALLWSLTCDEYVPIDAARLHTALSTGKGIEVENCRVHQDPQSAQNVRELLRTINFSKRGAVPLWLREQMLYTYACARNWPYFWKEWNMIQQSLTTPRDIALMQTKLVFLLAMINDKIALRDFFCNFWDTKNSSSFINQWEKANSELFTAKERKSLKRALDMIYENHGSSSWFENARVFATTL
ncbi:ATP25 [Candida theae]|uniref:ATPase synthesis protein 25 n=1 Tax=Candida theae TaxID=1198502 RepID=A0AAD5BAR0_9ASCO|nr:ATP25 [Candida theae]KAI5948848.1 ATP25 [Candida theae]